MLKKTLFIIMITIFILSCNKNNVNNINLDNKVNTNIKNKKINDEIIIKAKMLVHKHSFDAINDVLRKEGDLKETIEKFKNLKEINFYLTKNQNFKLETIGLDLIDLALYLKGIDKNKIQKKDDFKYIYLDDEKKHFLISKKGRSVLSNINLEDAFEKQNIPLNKDLKNYLKMVNDDSLFVLFKIIKDIEVFKMLELEKIKSGFFVQTFEKDKIIYKASIDLGKDTGMISEKFNEFYSLLKKELIVILKEAFNKFPEGPFPVTNKDEIYQMMVSVIKNVSISSNKNILEFKTQIAPAVRYKALMYNATLIGIIIPAYKGYKKKEAMANE